MNTEVGRLNAYKEKTKVDGEELVLNVFPKRVFEMEDILASDMFFLEGKYVHSDVNIPYPINPHNSLHPGDDMDSGLTNATDKLTNDKQQFPSKGSFVYALPNGSVSYNKHIKAMIEKTKPCLTQLMIEAQLVRLWVQFNIPRIEDGNNFGVGIQEEILGEASGIERDACTFLDQVTRYYASRGKLVGKVAKYPHIEDYRECIRDMDEKQAITMRYIIMEIRNHYATLHDIIIKNLDRIKMPRSNNAINMY
ncbi:unnamed protein product [Schistosoma margrebowiei]|uniref:Proteasome activator PA28 C-terminal domain-containing protein n=1 Tax=Schistosoma margrebowiei TaxID=48269 RepID=A0AA84ZG13_9TREM|nr:unnamed protein product [Schistosoma margrebowiei]